MPSKTMNLFGGNMAEDTGKDVSKCKKKMSCRAEQAIPPPPTVLADGKVLPAQEKEREQVAGCKQRKEPPAMDPGEGAASRRPALTLEQ